MDEPSSNDNCYSLLREMELTDSEGSDLDIEEQVTQAEVIVPTGPPMGKTGRATLGPSFQKGGAPGLISEEGLC